MKNKKGFTLVEVAISVSLLSFVMVFMLKFVSEIRKDEDSISLNTDMLLNKAIISKTINEDVNEEGISTLTCSNIKCTINLKNNKTKTIEITDDGTKLTYKNITDDEIELVRVLPNEYVYNIKKTETSNLYLIEIEIDSHPEYNIEIVNKKS